ncbi:aspartyl protease family protein [Mucilaginibacter sp. X4EP1]|uniref:retropepsin-like aspartic protease n=1 Tax=Mucilaginibacter sp. X4EP1 TaxID=2723092 RepID=UPI0021697369|nr:retropepsin-like aspartic protease [Mucilaginibacter sp. X4EP1]
MHTTKSQFFFIKHVIVLSITLFSAAVQGQTSVPFTLTNEGHILVTGTINGVTGKFIFDTGAGMTVISKQYADKINDLQKQDAGFTGLRETGEKLSVDLYKGKTLSLGSFTENNPIMGVLDVDLGPCDGLVSIKSFGNQPFTIDFQQQKITFETPKTIARIEKTGRIIPLQLEILRDKTVDIFAYFKVNNKLTLQFIIDSGAGKNVFLVDTKYINLLGIDTLNAKKRYKPSEFDPKTKVTIYMAPLQSIAFKSQPGINIQNVKAAFIPGLIYDGKVSLSWIGEKIAFDLKKQEMIVP